MKDLDALKQELARDGRLQRRLAGKVKDAMQDG